MQIREEVDLTRLNTLAVPSRAQYFAEITSVEALRNAWQWALERHFPVHILGGGSNVLLPDWLAGLTLQIKLRGCEELARTEDRVWLRFGAGENWHDTVRWCLQQGFYGLENLALIPGTVGAAPIQNIGAYGVEVGTRVDHVAWFDFATCLAVEMTADRCEFAYRDSVFKGALRDRGVITHVTFCLSLVPELTLSYPGLQAQLGNLDDVTAEQVFNAVCHVRQQKLPDPRVLPNCGSFFKNPVVSLSQQQHLQALYPDLPSYDVAEQPGLKKLAAGWLIDKAGWRGQQHLGVRVHSEQALVLTNPTGQSIKEILALAEAIRSSVEQQFAVTLEQEPQILGKS